MWRIKILRQKYQGNKGMQKSFFDTKLLNIFNAKPDYFDLDGNHVKVEGCASHKSLFTVGLRLLIIISIVPKVFS